MSMVKQCNACKRVIPGKAFVHLEELTNYFEGNRQPTHVRNNHFCNYECLASWAYDTAKEVKQ